jgi:hypothetical protein
MKQASTIKQAKAPSKASAVAAKPTGPAKPSIGAKAPKAVKAAKAPEATKAAEAEDSCSDSEISLQILSGDSEASASDLNTSDEESIDAEIDDDSPMLRKARAEARSRSQAVNVEGKNSFHRNMLRQITSQSADVKLVSSSMSKALEHFLAAKSSTTHRITNNQELALEVAAIKRNVEDGVFDAEEGQEEIKLAKDSYKKYKESQQSK